MADTIAGRVAAGAAFLDRREAAWAARVNLGQLDLSDCQDCVLGQLGAPGREYDQQRDELGLTDSEAIDLGFGAWCTHTGDCGCDEEYAALTAEWKRVITGRQGVARG